MSRASAAIRLRVRLALAVAPLVWGLSGAATAQLPTPCIGGNCAGGPSVWVTSGDASATVSGSQLTVTQTTDRAILNWASFDVGADGSVVFDQPDATSVALNRIYQQDPSVILGAVSANGQVYLINPNGLIFGEGARINVQSLVASTLDVDDAIFESVGIVRAIDQDSQAAFEGGTAPDANITIEQGAELVSAGGGRIVILAPDIVNRGRIESPDGQALLAASTDRVYLQASGDSSLRGLLVEVETGGSVTNLGDIIAERGNITIAGLAINQSGTVQATTSVRANGSVRLLARDQAEVIVVGNSPPELVTNNAGELVFGEGSVTQVLAELSDPELAVDDQVQSLSTIEAMGRQITLQRDALVQATGGDINLRATINPRAVDSVIEQNDSQIFIDEGAVIDASGDDSAVVAMERNVVEVELRGNELADAPLQRDGVVRGEPVRIDVRVGTPLANVDGATASIERGIGERLSAGGTVTLGSEGSVVMNEGAVINVSGGQVRYEAGIIDTTQLVSNGVVVDIGEADPNVVYDAIATGYVYFHERWGITETFPEFGGSQGRFEAGYIEGRDAGSININSPDAILNGRFLANRTVGRLQRLPTDLTLGSDALRPFNQVPAGGSLSLDFTAIPRLEREIVFGPGVPTVVAPGAVLPPGRVANVPSSVFDDGVQRFAMATNGGVVIGPDVTLNLAPGGAFDVAGREILLSGQINVPSGEVRLASRQIGGENAPLVLTDGAGIDVSGTFVNDLLDSDADTLGPVYIDAGSIELDAAGDLTVQAGVSLVANGGVHVLEDGRVEGGRGGDVSLRVNLDRQDASIALDGEIEAFALEQGGRLALEANRIVVGAASDEDADDPSVLVIDEATLESGGFSEYAFTANRRGLLIADGTDLVLIQRNAQLDNDYLQRASGSALPFAAERVVRPILERGPVSLSLTSNLSTVVDPLSVVADVVWAPTARIELDPEARLDITSDASLFFDGTLIAPSANVTFAISNTPQSESVPLYRPTQQLRLGAGSLIDTRGRVLIQPDDSGYRLGRVTQGGSVAMAAQLGALITEAGSTIDVSGISGVLDLTLTDPIVRDPVRVTGRAGSIDLRAAEAMILNGDLLAQSAGTPDSEGGALSVVLDQGLRGVEASDLVVFPTFPTAPPRLTLTRDQATVVVGRDTPLPESLQGRANVSEALIENGGFAQVTLAARDYVPTGVSVGGAIVVQDGVDLATGRSIVLESATINMTGGEATLSAPLVVLGSAQLPRREDDPVVGGSGSLNVRGDTVDLRGTLSLNGVDNLNITARDDVRLRGELNESEARALTGQLRSEGSIMIDAQRVYPTVLSDYVFDLTGDASTFTLLSSAPATAPLSAAGSVVVNAADILIDGNLRSPAGRVELNARNSLELGEQAVVSVASDDNGVLFGRTQGEIDWVYPLSDQQNLVYGSGTNVIAPPDRRVTLNADNMMLAPGAVVDLSGGGDLLAYEFVPGPGGSLDILDPTVSTTSFAVVPSFGSEYAPVDPLESRGFDVAIGTRIVLAAGSGLPAGEYTVLPPRYALLPGAYLLTPRANSLDALPGVALPDSDGIPIVAGRFSVAGSGASDTRWQGFRVENGTQVRARAEYVESSGNAFFAEQAASLDLSAPLLPQDAGSLVLDIGTSATLRAQVLAVGDGDGLGGRVDIAAADISVVNIAGTSNSGVELLADELNALTVDSLALGGVRTQDDNQTELATRAAQLTIADGVSLESPELILAANDLTVGSDVTLTASGDIGDTQDLVATGDGALIVVSTENIDGYRREGATESGGSLVIGEGSELVAGRTLILDSTGSIEQNGTLGASGGRVILSASSIGLGQAPTDTTGLILQADQINQLDAGELILLSRSTVDLFSDVALDLDRLELRGAGLLGRQPDGLDVTLRVAEFGLSNPFGATSDADVNGAGALEIIADTILFGDGDYRIDGFATVAITASESVRGQGQAALTLGADTLLDTAAIVGDAGAFLSIDARGFDLTVTGGGTASTVSSGLGADLRLSADSLDVATTILAPGGRIALEGDSVTLSAGAVLDVSGRSVVFDDLAVDSAGGSVTLSANTGDVVVSQDTLVDVSGAGGEAAGQLALNASTGTVQLLGTLRAEGLGGSASVDTGMLTSFSDLNARLADGGFDGARHVRLRSGDLVVAGGDTVQADDIALTADAGSIVVNGSLVASGGQVALDASNAIDLQGAIDVSAAQRGGDVSLRGAGDDAQVILGSGSVIDLGGGAQGGVLRVALNENGAPLAGRFTSQGEVRGAGAAIFAPERHVDVGESLSGVELLALIDSMLLDNAALDASFLDGLNAGQVAWQRRPSLVVTTPGDLTVTDAVSLLDRRLDGLPGTLTVRAGGNLALEGTLSDGVIEARDFANQPILVLSEGASFDLNLIAGADLASASLLSTLSLGDITLGDGVQLRTGTGNIDVRAGGSLMLGDGASVYTAGATTGFGNLPVELTQFVFQGVEFPDFGGDLTVDVGGDILAVDAGQFVNDWLYRTGGPSSPTSQTPTLYGVYLQSFANTFGAFGGGDIRIRAGGSLNDVSIALPSTAQHVGDAAVVPGTIQIVTTDNTFIERPSGSLDLAAIGDIRGLLAYVANGELVVRAGGDIAERNDSLGAILMLGDALADVAAVGDVSIETILNPTVLPQSSDQVFLSSFRSFFFTYGDATAARLVSLAGDVTLDNDVAVLASFSGLDFGDATRRAGLQIYPSRLTAAALSGDVQVNNQLTLFPSATGNLDLLAFGNVQTIGVEDSSVRVSNADVALLPFADRPTPITRDIDQRLVGAGRGRSEFVDAAIPVHINDDEPSRIVALTGSVQSDALFNVVTSEPIVIRAAQDVRNVNLLAQNVRDTDITRVIAGRDVRFDTTRNDSGRILNRNSGVEIAGPGQLSVQAGRNIDLGSSNGILSIGNRANPTLADRGADLTLLAGLSTGVDFDGFIDAYFVQSDAFQSQLDAYVSGLSGEALSGDEALAAYLALPDAQREPLALATFFTELRESGVESADPEVGFDRGYTAIDTLFPGSRDNADITGDLRIFFSRVQTTDGGDISVVVPGGEVNAGLAAIFEGAKDADELGIVVQGEGNINGYVRDDFLVNQSRVFALDGGDILIWSTLGDIDAGRGAKTALAAPEPVITVDSDGNISVEFPATISGSGIRAGVSTRGREPGDVFLFAPAGVVSAGDAGIGSAGNVTIAATEVIGADNIDVGGVAVGVPVDTGGVAAGLAGVSNATAGAANAATEQVSDSSQSDSGNEESLGSAALAWLDLFVLGFGDDDDNTRDNDGS